MGGLNLSQNTIGIAMRSAAVLFFAISNAMVKWLTAHGFSVYEILFFRNAVATLLTFGVVMANGGVSTLYTPRPMGHVTRGVVGLLAMGLGYAAIARLPLTEATTISFSSPLWVIVMSAPVLKEHVGLHRWIAAAVGFCGVLVMLRPDPHHMGNIGALIAMTGAFFAASSTISVRQLAKTERGPSIVFYFLLFCTVVSAVPMLFAWQTPDHFALFMLLALGLVSGVTQLLFTQALRHARPSVVGPFDYTQVIWAAMLGYLFWGERLKPQTIIGGAIVIGSGLYIVHREFRKARTVAA